LRESCIQLRKVAYNNSDQPGKGGRRSNASVHRSKSKALNPIEKNGAGKKGPRSDRISPPKKAPLFIENWGERWADWKKKSIEEGSLSHERREYKTNHNHRARRTKAVH